jgi:ABC-type branched-subunit amino acid transport system permease subunit
MKINKSTSVFLIGSILLFGIVQVLISTNIINSFWETILLLAGVMAIVALGLNLIYGSTVNSLWANMAFMPSAHTLPQTSLIVGRSCTALLG